MNWLRLWMIGAAVAFLGIVLIGAGPGLGVDARRVGALVDVAPLDEDDKSIHNIVENRFEI